MEPKHGLVIYDVPEHLQKLSRKICKAVRKFGLMSNKSAYLFPWENLAAVRAAAAEAQAQLDQQCKVYVLAQHPDTEAECLTMAKDAAEGIVRSIHDSLVKRIAELPEVIKKRLEEKKLEGKDISKYLRQRRSAMVRDSEKRLEEVSAQIFALRIEGALTGWLAQAERVVKEERAMVEKLQEEAKKERRRRTA